MAEGLYNEKSVMPILEEAVSRGRKEIPKGEVATYIPELGKADKNALGICMITKDGKAFSSGDIETRFTIQSISKIISLIIALERCGFEEVFAKAGMEPSGEAFNSLVQLDLHSNRPFNPMINSGAIAVESLLVEEVSFDEMVDFSRKICMDPEIELNEDVFKSEMKTCSRNRAIAYLLESKDIIRANVEDTLFRYTQMCSLNVNARSLANLGMLLACDGVNPLTGDRFMTGRTAQIVKTIMLTCGMYDGSGQFAVEVGFPTKSGVGGGLLSVVDKHMGIGIYGPSLDEKGNCVAGSEMLRYISKKLGLHIFHA